MRILVAVDGSACSDVAVGLVRNAPWPQGSQLRVVTVQLMAPSLAFAGRGMVVAGHDLKAALAVETASMLSTAGQRLRSVGLAVECEILHGFAADAILEDARRFAADLIVVGSRGHGSMAALLLGSVSGEVSDRAQCSVLVARRQVLGGAVLAVDDSPGSAAALRAVAEWPLFESVPISVTSIQANGTDPAAAVAAQQRLERGRRTAELVMAAGDPGREIVRIAEERDADLVVVGPGRRGGIRERLMGGTARAVLRHSRASVLVVREPAAAERDGG